MAEKTLFQKYLESKIATVRGAARGSDAIDITGDRYGKLTIVSFAGVIKKKARWNCVCDCGVSYVGESASLRSGRVRHCGDIKKHSPAYNDEIIKLRFMSYVRKRGSGCWEWIECFGTTGYGQFKYKESIKKAHRVSYIMFVGPIPEGAHILHSCDNPACVNPSHLRAGTREDNLDDMKLRDRTGNKLSTSDVKRIKRILSQDKSYGAINRLARWYGVDRHAISNIKHGRTWSYINGTKGHKS